MLVPLDGTVIPVRINGVEVETKIVEGVQRLPSDPTLELLFDAGVIDLNKLWCVAANHPEIMPWVRNFYLNIGYSLGGYSEVFAFCDDEIKNPLWEDAEEVVDVTV